MPALLRFRYGCWLLTDGKSSSVVKPCAILTVDLSHRLITLFPVKKLALGRGGAGVI
jgi:hypothetical protein